MDTKTPLIAAAVAAGLMGAMAPGVSDAAVYSLVIAGSSAALNAMQAAVQSDICGPSSNFFVGKTSGASANFIELTCQPTSSSPAFARLSSLITAAGGNTFEVFYRSEGGSVVGALPLVNNTPIARAVDGSFTGTNCTISTGSGTADVWSGSCTTKDFVQLGITDLEPSKLTFGDYPSAYSPTAFGTASSSQMAALPTTRLFQQVFGIFVNTSNIEAPPVALSKATVFNIYVGNYSDWANVPDALTGNPVGTATQPIAEVDREAGSGTRTSADVYFYGYHCPQTTTSLPGPNAVLPNNFATGDEINAINTTPGGIGYASIDNLAKFVGHGAVPVDLNGVTIPARYCVNGICMPDNLTAAAGAYDYFFEATAILNTAVSNAPGAAIANELVSAVQNVKSGPQLPDVIAIPGLGGGVGTANNGPGYTPPLQNSGRTGTLEIYTNPYTRTGNSCNAPTS